MSRVEGSTVINTPPETVLEALEDVANAHEWVPSLEKIWDIQGKGTGCSYKWKYKLGAVSFNGSTQITMSTPTRFVMNTTGGVPSKWIWTMSQVDGGTKLNLAIDYEVPGAALGAIANRLVVEKQNERELTQALSNLKERLEG